MEFFFIKDFYKTVNKFYLKKKFYRLIQENILSMILPTIKN